MDLGALEEPVHEYCTFRLSSLSFPIGYRLALSKFRSRHWNGRLQAVSGTSAFGFNAVQEIECWPFWCICQRTFGPFVPFPVTYVQPDYAKWCQLITPCFTLDFCGQYKVRKQEIRWTCKLYPLMPWLTVCAGMFVWICSHRTIGCQMIIFYHIN